MGEVDVDAEAVIEGFPDTGHLLPLGDGVGGHKGGPDGGILHILGRFEIPAGDVVNFSGGLIGLSFFIHINGQNILFLFFALQRVAHKRRVSHDIV